MMTSKKNIVAGGKSYADIDVLACISAYTQLLNLKKYHAEGVITGPLNQTITQSIRTWPLIISKKFKKNADDSFCFILMDLSDPKYMEEFVTVDDVAEVYDHHYGHEMFWKARLPKSTHIEKIGACATLIWERFKEEGIHSSISTLNANLLYTAIFANTLNFKSTVTDNRDILASEELLAYTHLPANWKETYYQEVAESFHSDLSAHILKDTKMINLQGSLFYFGQIEMWNAASVIDHFELKFNPKSNDEWLINIASIEEERSYLYTNSDRLKDLLKKIAHTKSLNPYFEAAERLWQRKELLREFLYS